jgi:outer membrane protein OmpA-like peptidoglycan-associated protein
MYRLLFFLLSSLFLSGNLFAQGGTLSRKGRDLEEKAAKAWAGRDLDRAEALYSDLAAVESTYYLPHIRLAQLFEWKKQPEKVRNHFEQAIRLAPDSKEVLPAYQWLAKKAQQEEAYQKAASYWQRVIDLMHGQKNTNLTRLAERQLEAATYAEKAVKSPIPIEKKPLNEAVNRLPLQFFPVLTADEETLFFTGLTPGGDEDIYTSTRENGEWAIPVSISKNINTSSNEGTCTISADGHTLVFTGCNRMDGFGSCDLYISYRRNGDWSPPMNIGEPVNSRHWESQPSLSADGRVLYFASDRPGGVGKSDIWKSVKDEKGGWTEPVNLGPKVNSPDDENAPFIHANGETLIYASKGHPGMGNFDLFIVNLSKSDSLKPFNLGYPINNAADQVGFYITADGGTAYYTEDRVVAGEGRSSRLFTFDIPEALKKLFMPTRFLKGRTLDSETQRPVHAEIKLYDLKTRQLVSTFTSDEGTGEYLAVINSDSHYALYVESPGYLFKSMSFDVTDKDASVQRDILVEKVKKDKAEVLTNVYFDTGESRLSEKSKLELDKLVTFLNENKNVTIEVSGHTDDVGSEEVNLKLSDKRAESVRDFLIQNGVSSGRVQFKGYGEQVPKVPNTSDENRRINRRIEWRIL